MSSILKSSILILFFTFGYILIAQTKNELSEVQQYRAQIFQLRMQLTQCQVQSANTTLNSEQAKLLDEFRKTLKAKDNQEFDWNTLTFKDAPVKGGFEPPIVEEKK